MEWWVWLLIIAVVVIAAIVIWYWWNSRRATAEAAPMARSEAVARPAVSPSVLSDPDDLTVIEGIGPKIAAVLSGAGISTFAALADADPGRLEQILREANLPLAKPDSWPRQARLAADGKMDELAALQESLVAGR